MMCIYLMLIVYFTWNFGRFHALFPFDVREVIAYFGLHGTASVLGSLYATNFWKRQTKHLYDVLFETFTLFGLL